MATVQNRSRYRVTVKGKGELLRDFPYNRLDDVRIYLAELRSQRLKPKVNQLEDSFEVRIRQRGYPEVYVTLDSEKKATNFVKRVEEERSRGLFIDYTKSHNITLAELFVRFLRDESSTRKSGALEMYKVEGWLEDSGPLGAVLLERYREQQRAAGKAVRLAKFRMREVSERVEWIHKRLTEVTAEDIESYVRDRLEDVQPSTVDRELDILSSVFSVVTKVWGYHLAVNPMTPVRRPRYFNERDRRLKVGEEERLLDAARTLDHERAAEELVQRLIDERTEGQTFSSLSARKKVRAALKPELLTEAQVQCQPAPLLEAFVEFQLMTAARRGETLGLVWDHVDFDAQTAFLPETKNGRPRKLSLRRDLLELLGELPRTDSRVFPMGNDSLANAWKKICALATVVDLHIHDLRHEAISRVAEIGSSTEAGFGLVELQAFSGHRDTRMLLRYAHLCATRMAKRLDEAFKDADLHKGRRRPKKGCGVSVRDFTVTAPQANMSIDRSPVEAVIKIPGHNADEVRPRGSSASARVGSAGGNVIPFRKRAA